MNLEIGYDGAENEPSKCVTPIVFFKMATSGFRILQSRYTCYVGNLWFLLGTYLMCFSVINIQRPNVRYNPFAAGHFAYAQKGCLVSLAPHENRTKIRVGFARTERTRRATKGVHSTSYELYCSCQSNIQSVSAGAY